MLKLKFRRETCSFLSLYWLKFHHQIRCSTCKVWCWTRPSFQLPNYNSSILQIWTSTTFSVNVFSGSDLLALIGESLTSHVVKLTPIFTKILTSCSYNCWPLLLRMSVALTCCSSNATTLSCCGDVLVPEYFYFFQIGNSTVKFLHALVLFALVRITRISSIKPLTHTCTVQIYTCE